MPIRNQHRVGDYLMQDDESGFVHYRSQMVQRWDGLWVYARQDEPRHPQEFVMALNDPRALDEIRPSDNSELCCGGGAPLCVGLSGVKAKLSGPGSKFFDKCLGDMCINHSFFVRAEN